MTKEIKRSKPKYKDEWYVWFSNILIISGAFGLLSSFMLTLDKIHVVADSTFQPDCSLNPVISCVSVMQSTQSEILGFPNQVVGIAAFSVFITVGVLMRFTKSFDKKLWQLLTLGTSLGFLVILWLISQSLYVIGALCLWCMLTWIIFTPLFWYSLLFSLKNNYITVPKRLISTKEFIIRNHLNILIIWYVILFLAILNKFWYYWETLI